MRRPSTAETKDKVRNAYDNSIRYTDHVLDQVIFRTRQHGCRYGPFLLLRSWRGPDGRRRNRFLHASPTPTYYQLHVASFAWFSDRYRELFPEKYRAARENCGKPATSASVFHNLADIASLRSPMSIRRRRSRARASSPCCDGCI